MQQFGTLAATTNSNITQSSLREDERDKRFDEALNRFVHEVVALDVPAEDAVARVQASLEACAPRKRA